MAQIQAHIHAHAIAHEPVHTKHQNLSTQQRPPLLANCTDRSYCTLRSSKYFGRSLENLGGVGGSSSQRKKCQRAGRLHFPLREENTRQKPPHKTKGLREFYRFWGVQLHISRCACICLSSQCLRQGWEGPTPGPTLPWGPPQREGPVASNPSFWWPDTTWAQFKSTASRILG